MVKEVHITLTYRFLERLIFILIILVLGFLLIKSSFLDDCDCENIQDQDSDNNVQNPAPGDNSDSKDTLNETEPEEELEPEPEPEPEPEEEPEEEPETQLSGEVEVSLAAIDFAIQEDGRAKINNIKVIVENGLDEDVVLFATIELSETGNTDLEAVNPFWDKVSMPLVKSGEKKTITLDPSKSWPPAVEDGDSLIIYGTFEDFQGDISVDDQRSQKV